MFVLDLATRNHAFRSVGSFAMLVLLVSNPIVFIGAAVILCVRYYHLSSPASGLAFRHLLSPTVVAIVHGIYIVGFIFSPWPVAINGM